MRGAKSRDAGRVGQFFPRRNSSIVVCWAKIPETNLRSYCRRLGCRGPVRGAGACRAGGRARCGAGRHHGLWPDPQATLGHHDRRAGAGRRGHRWAGSGPIPPLRLTRPSWSGICFGFEPAKGKFSRMEASRLGSTSMNASMPRWSTRWNCGSRRTGSGSPTSLLRRPFSVISPRTSPEARLPWRR